ncbi:MAG TPA: beta-ketoacyl-[acyl-carrier-protein] synthase family protein [Mycobacteriales bacterium]|jgi:3-oxoacyl-[acyl-carrier-protein] synthase II|nr:beta-ketoacyl-[acyl-carrier-protein] synthase family protein [Mycobacteriales bacterium]
MTRLLHEPVAVTGMGATTPVAGDVAGTWAGILAGTSGVRRLTAAWADTVPVDVVAPLAVDPAEVLERVQARTLDRSQRVALIAAREAWADAGAPDVAPERLAVVVATGIGGAVTLLAQADVLRERGARAVSPHLVPMLMPNGPAATVGLELGARGGVHTPVSACASGAEALAQALDLLRLGRVDVVVAGGAEACIHPLPLAGFAAMRALSTRFGDHPEQASRPFDKQRDGFVLGEGAGILVLERLEDARARGARVHGLLAGAGMTSDAHHVSAPDPSGSGAARAVTLALQDAGLDPAGVGHVNAHATSTPVGDVAEARALRQALGEGTSAVVTATKSCTGHLLGAAGAVEAILTLLALRDQTVPAVRNLDDPDDEVGLDVVRIDNRRLVHDAAISTSFGFGGHNVALAFRAAP